MPVQLGRRDVLLGREPEGVRGAEVARDGVFKANEAGGAADVWPQQLFRGGQQPAVAGGFAPNVARLERVAAGDERGQGVGVRDQADGVEGGGVAECLRGGDWYGVCGVAGGA